MHDGHAVVAHYGSAVVEDQHAARPAKDGIESTCAALGRDVH